MSGLTLRIMGLAPIAIPTACAGVSPNSSTLDPWSDGGGDAASIGNGSANGGSGAGSCGSCSSDGECQRSCGAPAANTVWCCSQSVGCYQFSATSCPMSTATATGGTGTSGVASGTACMGPSTCGGGMKCCLGGGFGQGGGTCQTSCSSGLEACQQNSDCSAGGICLIAVCLPGLGGGGRLRDAGGGG